MKKNLYLLTSIIASQVIFCSAAIAQTVESSQTANTSQTEQKSKHTKVIDLVSGSLSDSKTAGGNGGSAQFSFTSEGSVASLKFAKARDGADCKDDSLGMASCTTKSWDLTLSAPFDNEGGQLQNFANLDGVSSGVNAALKYSFGRTAGVDTIAALKRDGKVTPLFEEAKRKCLKNVPDRFGKKPTDVERIKCAIITEKTPHSKDGKFPEDSVDLIERYYPGTSEATDDVFKDAYSYFINVEGKIGYDDFDFIDPTNLSAQSTEKFEYSAGLSATYVSLGERQFGITAGANYQSDFEQADEAITCLSNMDEISCASGRPTAPERQDSLLGFTEVRHVFDEVPLFGKLGVAPRVTYNFSEGVTGANVPFFLPSKDGKLSSGFQVGWRSDTDNIVAGIFFSTALSLFEAN